MFESISWLYVGILTLLGIWYYRRWQNKVSYWSRLGVPGPKPMFLLGNIWHQLSDSAQVIQMEWMRKYGKVYGTYLGSDPVLTIVDNELIKNVLIKDFAYFINRSPLPTYHELLNQNLLFAEDEDWRRARTITSPSFTTGKLKAMSILMHRCIDKLMNYFDKSIQERNGVIDTKKVIAGFTMDVIASAGFATETDSNGDRATESPFLKHGLNLFRPVVPKIILAFLLPRRVSGWLNIKTFGPADSFDYFINYTREIVKQRRLAKSSRPDLVQLMIDAAVDEASFKSNDLDKLTASVDNDDEEETTVSSGSNATRKLTENEIIANAIFFLIAGFETTSSTLSNCLYELSLNPSLQIRLYDLLSSHLGEVEDHNSAEFFDRVHQIPYLEAVIKETLRKYPPVPISSRVLSKDHYTLGNIPLRKGDAVNVSFHAAHYCPDYFPDPEHFDPERFMPENKHLLKPYTYMPFGLGPRNCIGMRFAYQEVRLTLARLILKYRFEMLPDTPRVLGFEKTGGLLSTTPFQLKVVKRE